MSSAEYTQFKYTHNKNKFRKHYEQFCDVKQSSDRSVLEDHLTLFWPFFFVSGIYTCKMQ